MARPVPSMDAWLAEAKADESAAQCGMYLVHNGVVRECSPVVFDPRKVYGTK